MLNKEARSCDTRGKISICRSYTVDIMLIYKLLLYQILVVNEILTQETAAKTLDVVVLQSKDKVTCAAGSSAASSGLALLPPQKADKESRLLSEGTGTCTFQSAESCAAWSSVDWSFVSSLNYPAPLLKDWRWEYAEYRELKNYQRSTFDLGFLQKRWQIGLTLSAASDADIILCSGKEFWLHPCYWFVINGWGGTTTGIRRCSEEKIPTERYPIYSCKYLRHAYNYSIVSTDLWSSLQVKWDESRNAISLHKNEDDNSLVKFEDPEPIPMKYLIIRGRGNVLSKWKIHKYNYLTGGTELWSSASMELNGFVCLAITYFLDPSSDSFSAVISTTTGQVPLEPHSILADGQWHEVRLMGTIRVYDFLSVKIVRMDPEGDEPVKFSVGSVRFCSDQDEVRVLSTTDRNVAGCQFLQFYNASAQTDQTNTITPEQKGCDGMQLLNNCTVGCSQITESFGPCRQTKICYTNGCFCSAGSTGKLCRRDCVRTNYGIGCAKTCGHCRTCDPISGCTECNEGYKPPLCLSFLPILKAAPVCTGTSRTELNCSVSSWDFEGEGTQATYFYEFQEQQYGRWDNAKQLDTTEKTFLITDLKPATKYYVRVIIYEEGKYANRGSSVRSTEAMTMCECPPLDIRVSKRNASINLENAAIECPREDLYVMFGNGSFKRIPANLEYLKPHKEYEFTIQLGTNTVICKETFTTEQDAPSKVGSIQFSKLTKSSAIVSWTKPEELNGILNGYEITCKLVKYKNCVTELNKVVSNFTTNETQCEIRDLDPYAVYEVSILAFTVARGDAHQKTFETSSSDAPAVAPGWCWNLVRDMETIHACLKVADCSKLGGEFEYVLHVSGKSKWAEKDNFTIVNSGGTFAVKHLQPYSDYEVTGYHKRLYGSSGPGISASVKTFPSAPGLVEDLEAFSHGKDFVSLRWSRPNPPKGELMRFSLIQPLVEIDLTSVCILWEDKFCYNITGLEARKNYTFWIRATNNGALIGRILEGDYKKVTAFTQETAPSAPVNVTISSVGKVPTLKWTTPIMPHGNIRKFVIWTQVIDTDVVAYPADNETPRSVIYSPTDKEYEIQLDWLLPSTVYTIGVYGLTVDYGKNESVVFHSAHEAPAFVGNFSVVENSMQNGSVVVVLPASRGPLTKRSTIFVVVSVIQDLPLDETNEFLLQDPDVKKIFRSEFQAHEEGKFWIAAEIMPTEKSSKLVIGDNSVPSWGIFGRGYKNRPLRVNVEYNVTLLMVTKHHDGQVLWGATSLSVGMSTSGSNTSKLWLMTLMLLLVPLVVYYLYYRMRRQGEDRAKFVTDPDSGSRMNMSLMDVAASIKPMLKEPDVEQRLTKRICISDLENYVTKALASGELQRQHQLFPRGPTQPSERGQLPQNKSKNRYAKLGAYDANRVVLETLADDPFSDYINANFIEGYRAPKFYIAAQGPKPNTLGDFWRMIWQENVKLVIMLTNLVEGGKTKCEKYWPDNGKQLNYGSVTVFGASCRVSADFSVSTLHASCNGEKRTVLHYHFTSWPDHGVPLYTQSVAEFLKKILATPHGPGPMVVHCSAGVGRTGTVILADLCLRMAAAEGAVDVLAFQQRLREQRANMVDNFEQYKLVHLILLECLVEESTALSCEGDLEARVAQLRSRGNVQRQFQRLEKQTKVREPQGIDLTILEQVKHKNRLNNVVPEAAGRVYLSRLPEGDVNCDYINAVFVDGFRTKSQFITTQMPLPHTVADFWRMVLERKSTLVIVLNQVDMADPTMCSFWPSPGVPLIASPEVAVKMVNEHAAENLVIQTLQLVSASRTENVKMVHVDGWSSSHVLPASPTTLLRLWQEAERPSSAPIVVACRDGVTACGLFVALAFLVEKIKLEQICDVSQAVRIVKQNRKEFVQSVEQFNFLFDAGVTYVHEFATYANFN